MFCFKQKKCQVFSPRILVGKLFFKYYSLLSLLQTHIFKNVFKTYQMMVIHTFNNCN